MKILSIVPARGGSKGIPLKNLASINGKTLLYYTVSASLNSKLIDKTVVSTDHKKIVDEAKQLGAEVIKRSKKLANDNAKLEATISHVLEYLRKKEDYIPDLIVTLQNTSPLRTSKHIDEAISLLKKKNYDSVFSAYLSSSLLWKTENKKLIPVNYNPKKRPNRQEINAQFIENGAIYVTKYSYFKKNSQRISDNTGVYVMPKQLSYQIDEPHDLFMVEQLIKKKENNFDDFFSVKNKNIVLTGSSGLLGSHYARLLLKKGANLALIDINPTVSKSILAEFSYTQQNIKFYKCDLSKPLEIKSTFKKIQKDFSSIDILINNAAFTSRQTFHIKDFKSYEKHPFNLWKRAFEVNIDAIHLCTQQAVEIMKKQRCGAIINISSTYGVVGPDFDTYKNEKLWTPPAYAVTKAAILNFTRYIANLYGKYNIRCNTLTPSGVETKALSKSFVKKYSSRNAFKRMATPNDYSGPILFLCSYASRYMTGANLIVDGGWTAR